jgi:Caspase domain
MTGRALVFGAVVDDIRGVENDVRAIGELLAHRGFAVTSLDPHTGATRDAILASYHQLIADTEEGSDEPVVVYYAGHGGIVINSREAVDTAGLPGLFQCIIPVDYAEGSDDDFRGITSLELSALQNRLTRRTRNVTMIFDCCYSGQMSRGLMSRGPVSRDPVSRDLMSCGLMRAVCDAEPAPPPDLRPRSLDAPTPLAMRLHLDVLRARYPELFARPVTGNPHAVRAMACSERETAWPKRDARGEWYGVFTLALLDVLRDINGAPVSWELIGKAVSARVHSAYPGQQPRIEGPRLRRVFSLDEAIPSLRAVRRGSAAFSLDAGALAGVTVGDVYALAQITAPGREIARVQVTTVTAHSARAELCACDDSAPASPGTPAVLGTRAAPGAEAVLEETFATQVARATPRRPVRIIAAAPEVVPRLEAALAATRRLAATTAADAGAIADLVVYGSVLQLSDATGALLSPLLFPDQLPHALAVAERLATARHVLALEGEHGVTGAELAIDWGVVRGSAVLARPTSGAVLGVNPRIYLQVRNTGSRLLYVQLFAIGVHGTVAQLSTAEIGHHLGRGRQICFGATADDRRIVGIERRWPAALPRDAARDEALVVIATTRPTDLRALETPDARDAHLTPPAPDPDPMLTLCERALCEPAPPSSDDHLVRIIRYLVVPQVADAA